MSSKKKIQIFSAGYELRQNATTKEWVIMATERAKRSDQGSHRLLPGHGHSAVIPGDLSETQLVQAVLSARFRSPGDGLFSAPDLIKRSPTCRIVPQRQRAISLSSFSITLSRSR